MKLKRKTKKRLQWEQDFNAALDAFMAACGAVQQEPARPYDPASDLGPAGVEWIIETKAGPLKVLGYGWWIACRFDDVVKAREILKSGYGASWLNPYSGKWNFHFFPDENDKTPQDCLEDFRTYLDPIREGNACPDT